MENKKTKLKLIDIFQIVLVVIVVFAFLKVFVLDFALVSSNSMKNTLKKGDQIVFSKIAYNIGFPSYLPFFSIPMKHNIKLWYKRPEKEDVILFLMKKHRNHDLFIKRVIGVPSDRVYINDTNNVYPFSMYPVETGLAYTIPYKGCEIQINKSNISLYYKPLLNENANIDMNNGKVLINGVSNYVFKENYYFVAGDNYSNSVDSRHFGLIPESSIIGKPLFVYSNSEDKNSRRKIIE